MAARVIISACIFVVSFNSILSIDDNDIDYQNEKDVRVVGRLGRAYSLTGCDYGYQAGYSCVSCHRALHCYLGGAAIIVDCYGLFRYCRDGRCSRKQGAKCFEDTKLTTLPTALLNATNHVEDNINGLPLIETNDNVPNVVDAIGIEASSSNNAK